MGISLAIAVPLALAALFVNLVLDPFVAYLKEKKKRKPALIKVLVRILVNCLLPSRHSRTGRIQPPPKIRRFFTTILKPIKALLWLAFAAVLFLVCIFMWPCFSVCLRPVFRKALFAEPKRRPGATISSSYSSYYYTDSSEVSSDGATPHSISVSAIPSESGGGRRRQTRYSIRRRPASPDVEHTRPAFSGLKGRTAVAGSRRDRSSSRECVETDTDSIVSVSISGSSAATGGDGDRGRTGSVGFIGTAARTSSPNATGPRDDAAAARPRRRASQRLIAWRSTSATSDTPPPDAAVQHRGTLSVIDEDSDNVSPMAGPATRRVPRQPESTGAGGPSDGTRRGSVDLEGGGNIGGRRHRYSSDRTSSSARPSPSRPPIFGAGPASPGRRRSPTSSSKVIYVLACLALVATVFKMFKRRSTPASRRRPRGRERVEIVEEAAAADRTEKRPAVVSSNLFGTTTTGPVTDVPGASTPAATTPTAVVTRPRRHRRGRSRGTSDSSFSSSNSDVIINSRNDHRPRTASHDDYARQPPRGRARRVVATTAAGLAGLAARRRGRSGSSATAEQTHSQHAPTPTLPRIPKPVVVVDGDTGAVVAGETVAQPPAAAGASALVVDGSVSEVAAPEAVERRGYAEGPSEAVEVQPDNEKAFVKQGIDVFHEKETVSDEKALVKQGIDVMYEKETVPDETLEQEEPEVQNTERAEEESRKGKEPEKTERSEETGQN